MSAGTKIEWTDATWNPLRARNRRTGKVGHYCELISPGCANCYAAAFQPRFGLPVYSGPSRRDERMEELEFFLDEKVLMEPFRWKKPRRVFVCSMTDVFGDWVPDGVLDRLFAVLAMRPAVIWQVLTKRAERMAAYFAAPDLVRRIRMEMLDMQDGKPQPLFATTSKVLQQLQEGQGWPLPSVHLGVSAENREWWDRRVPLLKRCPAAVRFVSAEPLLGDLGDIHQDLRGSALPCPDGLPGCEVLHLGEDRIHWLIAGGESGPHSRPCDIDWIRSLVTQCRLAGTATFVKQAGSHVVWNGISRPGQHWPMDTRKQDINFETGLGFRILLRDSKGGDLEELPPDLRVREFPVTAP